MRAKLHALNLVQSATFRCADGMIFMTESSRRAILSVVGPIHAKDITIPHGVEERFVTAERRRRPAEASGPFRFLYLSIIDQYKHQDKVAEAAALLRDEGLNVSVDFVGPAYPPAAKKLEAVRRRVDPTGIFLRYNGPVAYDAVDDVYAGYDAFVFASSCETISSILIEAMASGLPIACSDRMPLPEVLAEAGVYFDPEDTLSIARAMKLLVEDRALRARLSEKAQERAKTFTWRRCAEATFAFLAEIATEHKRGAAQSRC